MDKGIHDIVAAAAVGDAASVPDSVVLEKEVQDLFEQLILATKVSNTLPSAADFPFQLMYPAFKRKMEEYAGSILHSLQHLVDINHPPAAQSAPPQIVKAADDAERFDALVEVLDHILEQADIALDEATGVVRNDALPVAQLREVRLRQDKTVVMFAANILRPQLKFEPIDNSDRPFVPRLPEKPNAIVPLIPPAEWEERNLGVGAGAAAAAATAGAGPRLLGSISGSALPRYPHPYETEIKMCEFPAHLATPCVPVSPKPMTDTPLEWVDTLEKLQRLQAVLDQCREFAVDLEQHSMRSYQGFCCLMQISTREADYLVEVLELRRHMHLLNSSFTNPRILKVLHGADMDVLWLQRDFGLYLVNMFDTGQAARVLSYPQFGLAYLLKRFCNVSADKKYQLADWRVRPLPAEMVSYAREDTHYLLYVFDMLRNELVASTAPGSNSLVNVVWERSRTLCLKTYTKEPFDPNAWRVLYEESSRVFSDLQQRALEALYEWRDQTARNNDESTRYVLPNAMLLNIAERMPTHPDAVVACCQPVPPLLRMNAAEIAAMMSRLRAGGPAQALPLGLTAPPAASAVPATAAAPSGSASGATVSAPMPPARASPAGASPVPPAQPPPPPPPSAAQPYAVASVTLPAGSAVRLAPVNEDLDASAHGPSSLFCASEDSPDEDDAAQERERAAAIRRSLSLALFMHDVAGVDTPDVDLTAARATVAAAGATAAPPAPGDPMDTAAGTGAGGTAAAADAFPRSIREVYVLSDRTRRRNKDRKQARPDGDGDEDEGGDGSTAAAAAAGSGPGATGAAGAALSGAASEATLAFLKELAWPLPAGGRPFGSAGEGGSSEAAAGAGGGGRHRRRRSKGQIGGGGVR